MTDDEEPAEKARLEAEARREKILQKSKDRMKKVSGLQAEADAEDEETKTSSAARMQAMRRRRFKKGTKSKETSESTEDNKAVGEAPHEEETKVTAEEVNNEPEPEKDEPEPEKIEEEPSIATESAAEGRPTAATEATSTEEESGESTKKYKGIAKVRREKMLAKKKEEQAKQEEDAATASSSPAAIARRSKKLKPPVLPIIMYMFTVLLLFLAGVDVGLQHVDDSILVHTDLAAKKFSLSKLNPWSSSSNEKTKKLESDNDMVARGLGEDEFGGEETTFGPDDPEYTPDIDPLFRIDLDAYTRGPGVFMQLARGAVKIHRFFLYLLWEIPMQVFALPMQFFQHPPVMCLVAVVIRQVVAKIVLGAKLPDIAEEDVRDKKEMTDVLDMIKNAVKSTLVGTFPTAVSLYEAFTHLRADMYVVLCGVFVGLAYSSQMAANLPSGGGRPGGDYVSEPEESFAELDVPAEGFSDEL